MKAEIYAEKRSYNGYTNMHLVLEKEVSLDKIDSISVSYNGELLLNAASGDIIMELGELTGNLDIRSNSGDVNLKLSGDNAFDFTADTTSGDVHITEN